MPKADQKQVSSHLPSTPHAHCWEGGVRVVRAWFANGSQMVRQWFSDGSRMVREWLGVREDGIGQSHFERFRFDLMETVFDLFNVGMRICMISHTCRCAASSHQNYDRRVKASQLLLHNHPLLVQTGTHGVRAAKTANRMYWLDRWATLLLSSKTVFG